MHTRKHNKYDVAIRGIGVGCTLIIAIFAWIQHVELREREYKKIFLETQLEVTKEIFDVLREADLAKDEQSKKIASEKFWMIYQGKAQAFLPNNVLEELDLPAVYIASCIQILYKTKKIDCQNTTASQTASVFARKSKVEFQKNWHIELGADENWFEN